jgi:competence protein ComEC
MGLWIGALAQSLLFGINQRIFLFSLFVLLLITRKKLLGIIITSSFVGAAILSLHQQALQVDYFKKQEGKVVRVKLTINSDVRKNTEAINENFYQKNLYSADVKLQELEYVDLNVPFLLFGGEELAKYIPGDQLELFGRLRVFDGYTTRAGVISQVSEITYREKAHSLWRFTNHIRNKIKESTNNLPSDARALIPGLIIGDRSGQNEELSLAMRRSGLTHLTAVSGANFAIVAALMLALGRALKIKRKYLWWLVALSLMLFIAIVRPSSSVLRAAVMTGALLIARAKGVRGSPIPALATAISLLLLVNPFFVRDAGFGLSVFATAGLLFLAPSFQKKFEAAGTPSLLAEGLAIPISATVSCLPIIILLSGELSLISIAANFLVAPVIAIITSLGLILMLVAPFSLPVAIVISWCITPFSLWITFIARSFSSLPFAALKWPQNLLGSLLSILLLLLLAILFSIRFKKARNYALAIILIFLSVEILFTIKPFSHSWIPADWSFFQCDVGQGDGLIIKTRENAGIVIDVGPEARPINKCLKLLSITTIDLLVLTHFHADHVSGLKGAIAGREIKEVWTSMTKEPANQVEQVAKLLRDIPHRAPRLGERFEQEGVKIEVITVAPDVSPNDSSISILGNVNGITFFAAGDLELEGQARALNALNRARLRDLWGGAPIALMKAAHHGSALQDPELIAFLKPQVTFFSVGAGNPYGHPAPSALELYGKYGAIYRTDIHHNLALAKREGNLIVAAQPPTPWAR